MNDLRSLLISPVADKNIREKKKIPVQGSVYQGLLPVQNQESDEYTGDHPWNNIVPA